MEVLAAFAQSPDIAYTLWNSIEIAQILATTASTSSNIKGTDRHTQSHFSILVQYKLKNDRFKRLILMCRTSNRTGGRRITHRRISFDESVFAPVGHHDGYRNSGEFGIWKSKTWFWSISFLRERFSVSEIHWQSLSERNWKVAGKALFSDLISICSHVGVNELHDCQLLHLVSQVSSSCVKLFLKLLSNYEPSADDFQDAYIELPTGI